MLAETPPKEGTAWPANLVHPCTIASDGEQYSSWADLPRFHFHQYNLGAWSIIDFKGDAPANPAEMEKGMNSEFRRALQEHADQQGALAAFDEKVKGRTRLSDPAVQKGASFTAGNPRSRQFEVSWAGDPVAFTAVRIHWQNRRLLKYWYTLEYWDGKQFRLIEDRRSNKADVSIHEFDPVKSNRVRLTTWDEMTGWSDMPSVKAIDVFGQ
jgi:hypothetical protein